MRSGTPDTRAPAFLERDIKEARFVQHTLQIALQAVLDVCSHVVSDERLGEPRSNRELLTLLQRGGWSRTRSSPTR